MKPQDVIWPKNKLTLVRVLKDDVEEDGQSWALALVQWEGEHALAMRWNGTADAPKGAPCVGPNPTWFVLPESVACCLVQVHGIFVPEMSMAPAISGDGSAIGAFCTLRDKAMKPVNKALDFLIG